MMKKSAILLALLPLSAMAGPTPHPYVFVSGGTAADNLDQASLDAQYRPFADAGTYQSSVSSSAFAFGLGIGYQLTPRLGFEAAYINPGSTSYSATGKVGGVPVAGSVKETADVFSLDLVGNVPIPITDGFYGELKLGAAQVHGHADGTLNGFGATASGSYSATKTNLTAGIGFRYDFSQDYFAKFDLDYYKAPDQSYVGTFNVTTLSIGIRFQ